MALLAILQISRCVCLLIAWLWRRNIWLTNSNDHFTTLRGTQDYIVTNFKTARFGAIYFLKKTPTRAHQKLAHISMSCSTIPFLLIVIRLAFSIAQNEHFPTNEFVPAKKRFQLRCYVSRFSVVRRRIFFFEVKSPLNVGSVLYLCSCQPEWYVDGVLCWMGYWCII